MKILNQARPAPPPVQPASVPWSERYRPSTLDEVQGNAAVIDTMKKLVGNGNIPHLLLHGPPGTGKTSAAHALVHDVFGEDAAVDELNASDDRGIDVIRDFVGEYSSTASLDGHAFKILIMDEADNMTRDAQSALRRMMEKASGNCKFILCANDADGIIDPIRDRCVKLTFEPIPDETMLFVLDAIAKLENVDVDGDTADAIVERSGGSLRKAINFLQIVASGSVLPPMMEQQASEILSLAMDNNFRGAASLYTERFKQGPVGASDFIDLMGHSVLHGSDPYGKIALALSQVQLGRGKQDYIQVLGFLARLAS